MPRPKQKLLPSERNAVAGLSAILSLRMLGFYAVLPILSAYAASLPGARAVWIGMAVGIYGLTQAIFQIPLGLFSDRFGRRRAIVLGLLVFATGSVVSGAADDIWLLLLGRCLQGAGAVASVIIALAADLTRPVARTRAMAFMGLAIGLSFGIGLVGGPVAAVRVGVPALFYLTGILSAAAALYVVTLLPHAEKDEDAPPITWAGVLDVARRRELIILNLGTLVVHLSLTCVFVTLPIAIEHFMARDELWKMYLPIIGIGLVIMYVAARRADHPGWARPILWMGTSLLALACLVIAIFPLELRTIVIAIGLFTWGIALAEPILPALLTRFAPPHLRGTAAGVFNMHQFCGAFLGGIVGGAALDVESATEVVLNPRPLYPFLAGVLVGWTILAWRLPNPFRVEIARRRQERRAARRQPAAEGDDGAGLDAQARTGSSGKAADGATRSGSRVEPATGPDA